MDQQQCQSCGMKDHCQEVYKKLGKSDAPNVLTKVILAFLVPLILFIFSIVVGERLLIEKLKNAKAVNIIAFALAIAIVLLYVFTLKLLKFRRRQN
ncbi:MAG: SoxR reducing system RseC family protein [Planctomycetaceae bacterium]|nr:SoxR reducing system RseC family protein [Planctomycetaceae bacterium]